MVLSPQAMYFLPKIDQSSQNKNFPRQNTIKMIRGNCLKFLTKFQTDLMCSFEENVRKYDFRSKMAKFWTKKGSKNGPDFLSVQKANLRDAGHHV